MKLRTLLCIAFLAGHATYSTAEITLTSSKPPLWDIQGVITKSDLKELERAMEVLSATKATPTFRLNSEGGDVEVAIAIGRQLRRFQAVAVTFDQGKCYSSCVLVLAGGVRRILSNSIGIHRPYFSSTDQKDYQTTQIAQRRLAKLVKDYLEEMNVSPSLYDAMLATPPEKMRLLSESELQRYGLLEVDPVQQELEDAAEARKYGLSKIDFLRRKSYVETKCAREHQIGATTGKFANYFSCREAVLTTGK